MSFSHEGKAAIVTGGASGIGRSISRLLARDGAKVAVFFHKSADAAESLRDEVLAAGGTISIHKVDVRDPEALKAGIAEASDLHGPTQIFVHNAGISNGSPMMAANIPAMRDVFEVNFWAAVNGTQMVMRDMLRSKFGRIIYIGSPVATKWATQGSAAYAASKAALHSLARQVAAEVSHRGDFTANIVAPGYVRTDIVSHLAPKHEENILSSMCSGRAGKPDEIAEVVSFVASEQAAYVTGSVIDVDGGFSLKSVSRRKRRRNS